MNALTATVIEQKLASYCLPYMSSDIVSAKVLEKITLDASNVRLHLSLGFPARSLLRRISDEISLHLNALLGARTLDVAVTWKVAAHATQPGLAGIPQVKNIIAVASGKGGVGKSTTAVNLALALVAEGASVGILDADIYGPSQPLLLGIQQKPESTDGKTVAPIMQHGLQSMSIGYLIAEDTPMVWRGPMVTSALQQLLHNTQWQNVDYLIVDLPPGTGDIQLTLAQKIPVSGAVIVTTPQDLALADVSRAIAMFAKVNIPVLGIVENMALHRCSACGHQEAIFGESGAQRVAEQYVVPVLGSLPLDIRIRVQSDRGVPIVLSEGADDEVVSTYRHIALQIAAQLAQQKKNYSSRFPHIVIENSE